jgi:glycosyltransferase involved in cell wall biosynthesis
MILQMTRSLKKIVLIGPSYPFKGGIASYTTHLYRELAAKHEVLFVAFSRQYPDWLYPGQSDRDPSDDECQEENYRKIIDSLNPLTWRKAVREISDFKPDLVIFPWWVMFWAPQFIYMIRSIRRRVKSGRVVFLCHNVTAHEPGWLSRTLTRLTLRLGDGFLVHSARDKHDLEAMLDHPVVKQVEHPAYDLPDAQRCTREGARKKLGIGGDVVLFFGFVRPYKGLSVLLDAMAMVLKQRPCTLVVAGEVWGDPRVYVEQIERLGMSGQVRLAGDYVPQQDIAAYFGASDLVVLPYLSATGSGVLKLAYSHHRPVVVTSVGSLPDAVIEGETGYVVRPGDVDVLASSILAYFNRSDRSCMETAIAEHVRQFSWEPVIDALEVL